MRISEASLEIPARVEAVRNRVPFSSNQCGQNVTDSRVTLPDSLQKYAYGGIATQQFVPCTKRQNVRPVFL
jgi:hypothetical protein